MRKILFAGAVALAGLATQALAQQAGQTGSPGVGPGGVPPSNAEGRDATGGPSYEGRAAAPEDRMTPSGRSQKIDPMEPNPKSRSNGN